jgi:hypothetical protein
VMQAAAKAYGDSPKARATARAFLAGPTGLSADAIATANAEVRKLVAAQPLTSFQLKSLCLIGVKGIDIGFIKQQMGKTSALFNGEPESELSYAYATAWALFHYGYERPAEQGLTIGWTPILSGRSQML